MRKGILGIIGLLLLAVSALIKSALGFIAGEFTGAVGVMQGIALAFIGIGLLMCGIGKLYERRDGKEN